MKKHAHVSKKRLKKLALKETRAITKQFRASIKGPILDHAEVLHDDKGLPK